MRRENSSNFLSYEYASLNDVAQGGFSLSDSDIPLLVHVVFTVDSDYGISPYCTTAKPVSPGFGQRCPSWPYWSSCASVNKPTLSSFPGVWVYLFVCIFILTMPSSLIFPFPYLLVLSHPVCPPAMPNYPISNLIANLCPLLIDVGICQLPANWASLCWSIKVPE